MSTTTSRPDEAAIESIVDAIVDAVRDAFCPSNADSVSPSPIADDAASKASSATRTALSSLLTRLPPTTRTTTTGPTEACTFFLGAGHRDRIPYTCPSTDDGRPRRAHCLHARHLGRLCVSSILLARSM
ncbi:hypothetical protein GUJ93_ZPchr0011g27736 [Zizania palustris]|uniref:Uncharacterized protein n=1 Tax=Zizania palustris TaxID=103762 RepID=A0A8J5WMB2_ZIZPA|nr:hypothetical protein GUJ93_ZPchr0011g27736 [Zizania palustris]